MVVWVLEWSQPSEGQVGISLWETKEDAQKQAVKEITDHITNEWDMDDATQLQYSDEIDDLIQRGQLLQAMERFADYQMNYNPDYAEYWSVYDRQVLSHSGKTTASHSSSNGATCRGPCKQHNPYANADRSDGTYVCRQCSTFNHIFGNTP